MADAEPGDGALSYRSNTEVQPKPVVGEDTPYRNAEQDVVRSAFNPGSFTGIRSLPTTLGPNFRQNTYDEILSSARSAQKEAGGAVKGRPKAKAQPSKGGIGGGTGPALSEPVAAGQRKLGVFSPAPRVFSLYDYKPSEYEREREAKAAEVAERKSRWMVKDDFKRTALPPVPQSAGSFNEFEYAIDPYELKDEKMKSERLDHDAKTLFGPVKAGGHASVGEQGKIRREEVIAQLSSALKHDWASCFMRVFEDDTGLIVCCFDKDKVQGDLSTYMNHLFRTHAIVTQFQLRKDSVRWGIVEKGLPNIYYVFIPPWVHVRVEPDLKLRKPDPMPPDPALVSTRIPFGPQTVGGNMVQVHVRTHSRSFKF